MLHVEETGEAVQSDSLDYLKALSLLERAHRRFHEVIKDRLDRTGKRSLNGVQALLLYEIGSEEVSTSTVRGRDAFVGASMSYNLKKLQSLGFLEQERSTDDRRAIRLRLTQSGRDIRDLVTELFQQQAQSLEPSASLRADDLARFNRTAARLEGFWADQIRYKM